MPTTTEPRLPLPPPPLLLLLLFAAACSCGLAGAAGGERGGGSCDLSVERGGALYSFALAAPMPAHRHGVLSEDGFYKVAVNDSTLWFQLCDEMLFNFDPPMCLNCEDCGGPLRCGTQCSALVSNNMGGYDVCTTIGSLSKSHISLIDESNPRKGIVVKMFSPKCSISVSVLCDSSVAQVPDKFVVSGRCDYATTFKHPSGCARSVSASGSGWGWLGTLFITIMSLLGGYILLGAVYRYYFLGLHSVEAIPNLDFWISLPRRIKTMFVPATRSRISYNRDGLGAYAPANH
ncbi:hypothetical protein SETIT_9G437800v2 [Setaria italica]|uniref:Autophagy-related protein 27 n=1 Tax=Setaria italica TaxID=4555 RepID=A0A368SS34_SETIT|nr:uncharacterized protein LOC101783634 [Setaria italica]RCV45237.1 hypothetical protein SETIT_9G437800v2 [Setaria italica]